MSVIANDLQGSLHILKLSYAELNEFTNQAMANLRNNLNSSICQLISRFEFQIRVRDEKIASLSSRSQSVFKPQSQNGAYSMGKLEKTSLKKTDEELLAEARQQIKQYEMQIEMMLKEMKMIKIYLSQLEEIKYEENKCEETKYEENIQQKMRECGSRFLTKMSTSLPNIEKFKTCELLNTIQEVTEMSTQSKELYEDPCIDVKQFASYAVSESSFQCVSEVHDMNRMFFDNSQKSVFCDADQTETYEESLSILKNFGDSSVSLPNNLLQINLPYDQCIPTLMFVKAISRQHICYANGYQYTGNTVEANCKLVPMGFGQLFLNNELVYCGEWKNGCYDGWGKIFLSKHHSIKQFQGKLKFGFPNGPGCIRFRNGDRFLGTFQNGTINGEGTYILCSSREKYRGYWMNNVLVKQSF